MRWFPLQSSFRAFVQAVLAAPAALGARAVLIAWMCWGTPPAIASEDFLAEDAPEIKACQLNCPRILLAVNEEKVILLGFPISPDGHGVSIGNPKLLTTTWVRMGTQNQLVIRPLDAGSTTIAIRGPTGEIQAQVTVLITAKNLYHLASELRRTLDKVPGLGIRVTGSQIVIDGELSGVDEYALVYHAVNSSSFRDFVLNQTAISTRFYEGLAAQAEEEVRKFAPEVHARAYSNQIWLEGTVDTLEQSRHAEQVATLTLPELFPASPLNDDPTVQRLQGRAHVQNFIRIRGQ